MSKPIAGSPRDVNRQRVLDALLGRGAEEITYAQVAHETGLALGTVTSVVREFADAGVVDVVPGAGRRGATVRLGRGAGVVAGVDFGHTHLATALADMTGTILARRTTEVDADQDHEENLVRATAMIDELLADAGEQRSALRTVGLGLPAPIANGHVLGTAIMPGWAGVDVKRLATEAFGCGVVVQNDANLGALAEHRWGAGRGHSNVVFVKISSGLGAGMIVDERIFGGSTGIAGELGHLTFDEQGPLCRCGSRGCLEAYTSTVSARELMRPQLPDATLAEMVEAAAQGNIAARRVFEDVGLHLGWGLAILVNLLDPGVVIVGGDMAQAGDLLLTSMRTSMRRHVFAGAGAPPIVLSELAGEASVIGAVMLALDETEVPR